MGVCTSSFRAAGICASYGKWAPPANTPPPNHSELKVFGSVFYIPPGASVSAIYFLCSGELFEADKMYVRGGAGKEAETPEGYHTGVNTQGSQQLRGPLKKRSG